MPRSRKSTELGQSAFAVAWQAILGFLIKVVIPLIPIAGFLWGFSYFVNAEISGVYRGIANPGGAISLDLLEDNEQIRGELLIGAKRYSIDEGKMISDYKMELRFMEEKQLTHGIKQGGLAGLNYKQSNDNFSIDKLKSMSKKEKPVETGILQAEKEGQNHLSGQIRIGAESLHFSADRNSFACFAGWRWWRRMLNAIGIK